MASQYSLFKQRLSEIKSKSFAKAIQLSEECWTVKNLRNKGPFNKCTKKAVVPYAVYQDGKLRMKLKKLEGFKACGLNDECRSKIVSELLLDLNSLELKITREVSQLVQSN